MRRLQSLLAPIVLAGMGIALAIYSEADDAPGGVLMGFLLIAVAIWLGVKAVRRTK